jgi:hypothetical protein
MAKAIDRFMKARYDARAVLLMLLFVSICSMILEVSSLSQITALNCYSRLLVYINFYLVMFFSFTFLLRLVAKLPFEKAANPVAVGLLFGIAPPIIDYFSGIKQPRYQYFREFEPLLTAPYLPTGETIVLWGLVAATGLFTYYLTRSFWRAVLSVLGAYVIIQLHGFVFEAVICRENIFSLEPHLCGAALSVFNLIISFVIYGFARGRPIFASLMRFNHAMPHFMLTLAGAAWAQYGLANGLIKGAIVLFFFVLLLIHNDYYDQHEDRLADRRPGTTLDDVVWSSFFFFCLVFPLAQINFLMVFLLIICLLTGFLYHHPSVRLKERFCLSYKAEGVWALMAFLIGTSSQTGFSAHDLLIPSILVFGGGTLISIPKDWKDIESDRQAKIPTYYVVLTHHGRDEYVIHRRIVLCVTLGLLVPPIAFFFWKGYSTLGLALLLACFMPAGALLSIRDRKKAVETMLWLLTVYLFILTLLLKFHL